MSNKPKRTFEDVAVRSTRVRGHCVICGEPYPEGEFRGRIALVLYKHRPLSGTRAHTYKEGQRAGPTQEQKTVANETRIVCESCAVDLFERMAGLLPARQIPRSDKPDS